MRRTDIGPAARPGTQDASGSGESGRRRRTELAYRSSWTIGLPSEHESRLRRDGLNAANAEALWEALRARLPRVEVGDIGFVEGFSHPEAEGRWSIGQWSAVVVPLTPEQRDGAPVRLNAQAYAGGTRPARIVAYAGAEPAQGGRGARGAAAGLAVVARPLEELGGAGLILLWTPDARAPAEAGSSADVRELGLFIRRRWQGADEAEQPRLMTRLRSIYRTLPLPVRTRLSPALGRLLGQMAARSAPPPLPPSAIQRGDVVLSALLSEQSGIGRAGRMTSESLASWGVPIVIHDVTADPAATLVPTVAAGGVWICHCNAPEALAVMLAGTERLWARRYRIGYWAYELPRLPNDWVPALRHFHEIWAPSAFVADAIRRSTGPHGPLVRVVPHPVASRAQASTGQRQPNRPMMFLSMFDARSTAARKNPMGAIRAFQMAFAPNSDDATLAVKVAHGDADGDALRELNAAIAGWQNITLLTEHLSDDETLGLIGRADCLVSLHRSEGFGLPIAEAMSVGTPAIVTGWSAPVEFCGGAAIEIGYHLVPTRDASKRYERPGLVWADPDLAEAAGAMRKLVSDPSLWRALSECGTATVRDRLSRPIAADALRRFLLPSSRVD